MITLNAKISLISTNNDTLKSVSTNVSKINNSSEIGAILGVRKESKNPFIFGKSKFSDKPTFSSGVDYFIGSQASDQNGNFDTPYEIKVKSGNINSLTIAFDTTNNRHPKSLKVDGVEYFDDDAIFTIVGLENTSDHTIVIENWNKENALLVITGIYVNISIDINNRNLISLTSTIFDRGNYELPSYGIISNTGNIEFNDFNGEVKDYAEQLLLTSDLKVEITLKDTLTKKEEQIALMETTDWDYNNNNRSVSVSLQDDLVEWQNIQVDGFSYNPRNPFKILPNGSMEDLYRWLQNSERTPTKYRMLSFGELDFNTKNILSTTKIDYPFLESGTLWEQWVKLCKVCGLYIFKNRNGRTVCSYTMGS